VATLALDRGLYPLDVIYGAAYVLIDRAYVLLDKAQDGRTLVRVRTKEPTDAAGLEALAGEMANELLSQALRRKIAQQNRPLLEAIVTQAIAGASGALLPGAVDEDDSLDFLDDPLGIAVPWEEKFSKEAKKAAAAVETTSGTAGPGDSGGFRPKSGQGEP
jgi:His-Xaa-Ser system protein HxsD